MYNPSWSRLKTILLNLLYFISPTPTLMAMHKSREMKRRIESALLNNHYDIVQIELTQMAHFLPALSDAVTVLVEHDVTFISRYRRLQHAPNPLIKLHWLIQYLKLKHFEITYCKKFDLIITVSEQSKQELQKYCPSTRVSVIRTGVDLHTHPFPFFLEGRYGPPSPLLRGEKGVCCRKVLFLGSLSHWPNKDAVLYFYQSIFPLIKQSKKDVEFLIVGKDSEILPTVIKEDKSVSLLGFIDDIKPLL